MKKWQKAVFIVVLTVFVGASVWMTFNSVSRDTFEYAYREDIGGQGFDGWCLTASTAIIPPRRYISTM